MFSLFFQKLSRVLVLTRKSSANMKKSRAMSRSSLLLGVFQTSSSSHWRFEINIQPRTVVKVSKIKMILSIKFCKHKVQILDFNSQPNLKNETHLFPVENYQIILSIKKEKSLRNKSHILSSH